MKTEIWKDITWYEWLYQVSNLWNVKSLKFWKEKILKWNNLKWYKGVRLSNIKINSFQIHRLVLLAFIPNPENKLEVNHINWIKDDNRLENLEWVTRSQNQLHKYRVLWYKNHLQINHPYKWKFWINHHSSKKINQYDLDWNFIKTWGWLRDIQRELLIDKWNILRCCKWERNKAWWYKWKYL